MQYVNDYAAWLHDRMAERGISQRQLAVRAGLNHATISRLLRGGRAPSHRTAQQLAAVLDGPTDADLVTDVLRRDPWLDERDIARLVRLYVVMRDCRIASAFERTQRRPESYRKSA